MTMAPRTAPPVNIRPDSQIGNTPTARGFINMKPLAVDKRAENQRPSVSLLSRPLQCEGLANPTLMIASEESGVALAAATVGKCRSCAGV